MPALLRHLRSNVVAYLALFVALGGTSYAAVAIDGSKLKNRSVSGAKLKRNTLGGIEISESKLGKVPLAGNADKVGGQGATAFVRNGQASGGALTGAFPNPTLRCPSGTIRQSDFCFETDVRNPATWSAAEDTCAAAGRRLGNPAEMHTVLARLSADDPGEWTSALYEYPSGGGATLKAMSVEKNQYVGNFAFAGSPDTPLAYRCLVNAGNP